MTARSALRFCALLVAIAPARGASARERLAVLIDVEGDPALADNLTEVVISTLAERRDRELVGTTELRARLGGLEDLGACLQRAECLARIGAEAGTALAVIGVLRREGSGWKVRLSLIDVLTNTSEAVIERPAPSPDEVGRLIPIVQQIVRDLLAPRKDPPVAARPAATSRPEPLVTATAPLRPTGADDTRRDVPVWAPYAGSAAAGLAALSYAAAAFTGVVADGRATGPSRAAAEADLERRKDYALATNGLLIAGTALALAAAAAFVWWSRAGTHHDR